MTLQLLFIKGGYGDDAETSAGEDGDRLTAHEKMAVLGKHSGSISLGKNTKTAGFHQLGIRLVKILHLFKNWWSYLYRRFLHFHFITNEGLRIIDAINAEIPCVRSIFYVPRIFC